MHFAVDERTHQTNVFYLTADVMHVGPVCTPFSIVVCVFFFFLLLNFHRINKILLVYDDYDDACDKIAAE